MPAAELNNSPKFILLAAALLVPCTLYFGTLNSMIAVWNSSETYAHGYAILPISAWLIWRKRRALSQTPVRPYWPALILIFCTGVIWLLSDVGEIQVLRQYSFVVLMPLLVLALLGLTIFRSLAFPLFFLMLAVPFGDVFIAPLINFTADFTVATLQLTGIPVLRNGSTFTIPSGSWSVVDACSGVRYLISSITLGFLYAYLAYRSWLKRALFMLAASIVPIIANGVRAYLIVMLGHLSGMTVAVGVDHLIYGWLFFGLVMTVLFWIGNIWRDDFPDVPYSQPQSSVQPLAVPRQSHLFSIGVCALVVLALFPVGAQAIKRGNYNPAHANLGTLPSTWHELGTCISWQPQFQPAQAELERCYRKKGTDDQAVKLIIKYYRNQTRETQLLSSSNRMVLDQDNDWRITGQSDHLETHLPIDNGTPFSLRETRISGSRTSGSDQQLLVWSCNWINGHVNNNAVTGKIIQSWDRLNLNGDDAAAIILVAPYSENPDQARLVLRDFLRTHLVAIESVLNSTRKH